MPFVQLNGERVFYARHRPRESFSEAPVLVCVHGAGGSHLNWPAEIRRLPGAAVYVLDLPGHGRSTGRGRRTIGEYAAALASFLRALDLPSAVIVGHSMGGAVALEMALSYPDRVRGMVLIASGARLRVAPAILQGILDDFEGAVRLINDWAYGAETPDELKGQSQQLMAETSPEVMHGDFAACDAFDVTQRLSKIHVPTLVVVGAADRLTPIKLASFLAAEIPGAQLAAVESAGHMVMLERPQEVGEALSRFLTHIISNQALTFL